MSATLETCNIFVTDFYAPGVNSPTLTGSIMSVSPVTGNSNVISSGGLLETSPQDIEIDEQGDLIVTVNDTGSGPGEKVVRIDRVTGSQTVISQGGLIDFYIGGLAIEKNGDLIVGTSRYGGQKLIRINPQNGNQSILTKWSDPNDGPNDIAIESSGQILVAGDGSEKRGDIIYSTGAIYRVDPITGSYSIVSLGGELDELIGIAIDPRGQIFVTSWDWVGDEYKIVKVNTSTGSQSVVYKSTRHYLRGVDFDAKGDLIIAAVTSGYLSGLLLRVDPETGAEEVISSEIYYPTDVIATCNTTTPTPLKYSNAMPWIPLLLIDD